MKKFFKETPIWLIALGVVVLGFTLLLLFPQSSMDKDKVGERAIEFIDEYFLYGQIPIEYTDISLESGIYKITIMMDNEEFDVYATKDGKYLFPEGYDMEEGFSFDDLYEEQEIDVDYDEDAMLPSNIDDFVACLDKNDFKIFGADWCPYCEQLVDLFGGYSAVDSIYVECTDQEDYCSEKEIAGYPTILLADNEYQGPRDLNSFAQATQCDLRY